jgi:hypothetical protein
MLAIALLVSVLAGSPVGELGFAEPTRFAGLRLSEALTLLQARGFRIVYSSELVTPDMRVASEPVARDPAALLSELLKPHGLRVEVGPAGVLQIVRAPAKQDAARPRQADRAREPLAAEAPNYEEHVTVRAWKFDALEGRIGVPARMTRDQLVEMRSVLTDDPLRTLQSLPQVTAASDFHSSFSMRGSSPRHIGVVIEGVAAPWLQHTAYGRSDSGSISMFGSDVLEDATLQAGAYPQRHGDWLGGHLALTLREGSRTANRVHGTISGGSATVVGEGPIGGSERGAWLVAARQSFRDWPRRPSGAVHPTMFGFADAQAKLVYDVANGHQLRVTAVGGRSGIDGIDGAGPSELANGANVAAVVTAGWRSELGRRTVLDQQGHVLAHQYFNKHQTGQDALRGRNRELGYRADLLRSIGGALIEVGGQVQRTSSSRQTPFYDAEAIEGRLPLRSLNAVDDSWWTRAAYANVRWTPHASLLMSSGLRIVLEDWLESPAVARWASGEWSIDDRWTVSASAGVSHQLANLHVALDSGEHDDVVPERAVHAQVGIGRAMGASARWNVNVFSRRERGLVHDPRFAATFASDAIETRTNSSLAGRLNGDSRGIEIAVQRSTASGLTGWVSYAYSRTLHTDPLRLETFSADYDQRHTFTAQGSWWATPRTAVGLTFRAGANFPIPGYLQSRDGTLVVGTERNALRLPPYVRLDLRGQRTLTLIGRRVTLFAEMINVLNRRNMGPAYGIIDPATGHAAGFSEQLFPRLASIGLRIDF